MKCSKPETYILNSHLDTVDSISVQQACCRTLLPTASTTELRRLFLDLQPSALPGDRHRCGTSQLPGSEYSLTPSSCARARAGNGYPRRGHFARQLRKHVPAVGAGEGRRVNDPWVNTSSVRHVSDTLSCKYYLLYSEIVNVVNGFF